MYRLVILSIVAVAALAADLDKKSCVRMFHPHTVTCCKKSAEMNEKFMNDDIKKCLQLPKDPRLCEHEVCIAKVKGYATDDGKLDKTKLKEVMTKEVDDKDLLADMIANCVDGDLKQYGPPDACDFMKLMHCYSMQILNCEHEVCIAKVKGYATDDGKLDKTKLKEVMTKEVDDKDLLADMIANCVDGDLKQYGPPDACDFMKLMHCYSMQILNHCHEWNEFGECNQLKEVVADCVKLASS